MLNGRRQRENSIWEPEPEATEVEGNDEGSNYGRAETVCGAPPAQLSTAGGDAHHMHRSHVPLDTQLALRDKQKAMKGRAES